MADAMNGRAPHGVDPFAASAGGGRNTRQKTDLSQTYPAMVHAGSSNGGGANVEEVGDVG